MKKGDKVRITPGAWSKFVLAGGARPGQKFNPGIREVLEVSRALEEPSILLDFPFHWWKEEDLVLAAEAKPVPLMGPKDLQALTKAFLAVLEMWNSRYNYDLALVDNLSPEEGEPFPGPVLVDLGSLAVAYSELLQVFRTMDPDLHDSLFSAGGPDAILPPDPSTVPARVTNLDEVRIREGEEFQDEQVAYVEALWGRNTYAFNAAVRDLEAMRRGKDDGTLRRPETYHEGMLLVLHVRALANDLARNFGMGHLVREDDDLKGSTQNG